MAKAKKTDPAVKRLLQWLRANPEATKLDAEFAGFSGVLAKYSGSIRQARMDAGIDPDFRVSGSRYSERRLERLHTEFKTWLRRRPEATPRDVPKEYGIVLSRFYEGSMQCARGRMGFAGSGAYFGRSRYKMT
jgi:hypothetical protein